MVTCTESKSSLHTKLNVLKQGKQDGERAHSCLSTEVWWACSKEVGRRKWAVWFAETEQCPSMCEVITRESRHSHCRLCFIQIQQVTCMRCPQPQCFSGMSACNWNTNGCNTNIPTTSNIFSHSASSNHAILSRATNLDRNGHSEHDYVWIYCRYSDLGSEDKI